MNGYVPKPIDPLVLAGELEKWISRGSNDSDTLGAEQRDLPLEDENVPEETSGITPSRIFDRTALVKRLMDDQELTETIVTGFLEDMPGQISAVRSFVENGQAEQAGGQAHKIKGAAGNVTASILQETAREMETAGRAGDMEALNRLLPELENRFAQLQRQMQT